MRTTLILCAGLIGFLLDFPNAMAQRKPERVEAPKFTNGHLNSVFFPDAVSQLKGPRPTSQFVPKPAAGNLPTATTNADSPGSTSTGENHPTAWHNLISPTALEDLINGSKLRRDKTITTPADGAAISFAYRFPNAAPFQSADLRHGFVRYRA